MNKVELILDETLADFEIQDWIDTVFSIQYPDIKATIKKGCQGNCGDKYKEENEQLKSQIEKMKCCENCKHRYYENGINYCNNRCQKNLYNNWELKG